MKSILQGISKWLIASNDSGSSKKGNPNRGKYRHVDEQKHDNVLDALSCVSQVQGLMRPIWSNSNYGQLCSQGYCGNVVAYRCVNMIARGAASVPLVLKAADKIIDNHALLDLLNKPNPFQSQMKFIESALSYLLLAGNSYINVVRDKRGRPLELYCLRPDRINIIPGRGILPRAYSYSAGGNKRNYAVNPSNGKSDILHIKSFNPNNDWYGLSPLTAAAKALDQHNAVAGHNLALLQNGGRPTGVLMVGRRDGNSLSPRQREALKEHIDDTYTASRSSGKFMILEGDMEWKEMGLSPKDLDFSEGRKLSAREIAQAYGVPPTLVGVPGDATFANYQEARYHLWEDTIIPLLETVVQELNRWLALEYGDGLRLHLDLDKVPALAARREKVWARVGGADFLSDQEKRGMLGL